MFLAPNHRKGGVYYISHVYEMYYWIQYFKLPHIVQQTLLDSSMSQNVTNWTPVDSSRLHFVLHWNTIEIINAIVDMNIVGLLEVKLSDNPYLQITNI